MLSYEQVSLLVHLANYEIADKETCYIAMGFKPDEYVKASYALRPLVRYGYIAERSGGFYSLLAYGRNHVTGGLEPFIACSGNKESKQRVSVLSKVGAILSSCGILTWRFIPHSYGDY